ncbi:hypothetical protein BFJ66_g976 [Fusarium oxysporum f. sp. cepae]|nr:hypothetical protein BFJ67_g16024 [Fusarium oxysporum f. sp. cepae]RKK62168.1 hypothetical protein BFJ66_g976 [Fusarium oxysporum f. sp. cepae]
MKPIFGTPSNESDENTTADHLIIVDQINFGEIRGCSAINYSNLAVEGRALVTDPDVLAVCLCSTDLVIANAKVVVRNPDSRPTGPKSFVLERVPNERISLPGCKVLDFVMNTAKEGFANGKLSFDILLAVLSSVFRGSFTLVLILADTGQLAKLVTAILCPCSDLLHRASNGTKLSHLNTLTILGLLILLLIIGAITFLRQLVVVQKPKTAVLGSLECLITQHRLVFESDREVAEEWSE